MSRLAIELFIAEHALREQTQREETLNHRAIALQKAIAIDPDPDPDRTQLEIREADEQLEKVKRQRPKKEQGLYRAVSMLRPTWRAVYDSIKDDDDGIWFMCEEMVQDCSDRGGCCSRGCGCCARRRHLSKGEKGKGHCTSECWCCISCRGFDLPEEEKEEIASYMKRWLEEFSSPYLLNMANAFFCPLKPKVKSKPKAESQSTLRRLFERG
ncbi:unnamed protein product [Penicillium roqueforti FM164]|uniref:Genomic scaffold, ProqFM164S02 n=1 Tax=Penicillium roqueforti (strain FM164) TaxID=1365484 RepID=W6QRB5_PENRF|nr:unnamed protein product [Penicillium roqueforti FM164]